MTANTSDALLMMLSCLFVSHVAASPDDTTVRYQTHPEFRPVQLGLKLAVYTSGLRDIGEDGDEKRNDGVLEDQKPACLAIASLSAMKLRCRRGFRYTYPKPDQTVARARP